jgi:hypothetical protein
MLFEEPVEPVLEPLLDRAELMEAANLLEGN